MTGTVASCRQCGSHTYVEPLHGERGGPPFCPICAGAWHAEHGRLRRAGRIVIKALHAYDKAGGNFYGKEFDLLKLAAGRVAMYDEDARAAADEVRDLSTELLAATLALCHPDKHPPETKAEANRVTQELLALKPFVFPAPEPIKPEPPPAKKDDPFADDMSEANEILRKGKYPCEDCRNADPDDYCNHCRAEYEKRKQKAFEQRTAIQRADYKQRRERALDERDLRQCKTCGAKFKRARTDAHFCSDTCRIRAHRKKRALVTDKTSIRVDTSSSRYMWLEKRVLDVLKKQPAVFLNDILPSNRTRGEYQALCKVTVKLEAEGKIESTRYFSRFNKPGYVALRRPGHKIKAPDDIPRLQKSHPSFEARRRWRASEARWRRRRAEKNN